MSECQQLQNSINMEVNVTAKGTGEATLSVRIFYIYAYIFFNICI